VGDTGCGMSAEVQRRIFEPFFTTKPVGSGTGLGLSLSFSIVQKHGGVIQVHSVPGQGSAFRVWVPVAGPGPDGTAGTPPELPWVDRRPRQRRGGMTQRKGPGPLANAAVDVSALVVPAGATVPWFAAVLERSEVALVLVQADGVRYANPAARRLLAWDDGPLEGHQLTDWVVPEDRPRIAEQLRRRLAGEPGQFWEVQGLRRDGSRFDVRLCGQPVEVEGQAADLVTLFDVSETRQALRQAQWNADLLDHSEHLSRSGSYVLAWPEGRLRPSAGLRQLVGTLADAGAADPDEAWAWVAPDDRARVMQAWREAQPEVPFQLQHRALGAEGQCCRWCTVASCKDRRMTAPCKASAWCRTSPASTRPSRRCRRWPSTTCSPACPTANTSSSSWWHACRSPAGIAAASC
jgi:PAS domain S-box-containing protein